MPVKSLFIAADARCRHSQPLEPGESKCWECEFEADILKKRPPFDLECIIVENGWTLKKNNIYTAVAVVRDARDEKGHHNYGVILNSTADKAWYPQIFPLFNFYYPKVKK